MSLKYYSKIYLVSCLALRPEFVVRIKRLLNIFLSFEIVQKKYQSSFF